jgi:hypothetical protein
MKLDNHLLVQFIIGPENSMIPIRQNEIHQFESNKFVEGTKFWGVSGGSRYGVYRDPQATHWAVVDASNVNKPKVILYDQFEKTPKIKKVYKIGRHYAIMRNFTKFFKFQITEHSTISDLRNAANTKS